MPNWCTNWLTVEGDSEKVDAFASQAKNEGEEEQASVLSFQQIVPVPDDVLAKPDPFGYWARLVLWGSKWDAARAQVEEICDGVVEYVFDTAWSPPLPFVLRASEKFPGLSFHIKYEELGFDLVGRLTAREGQIRRFAELQDRPAEEAASDRLSLLTSGVHMLVALGDLKGEANVEEFVTSLDPTLALTLQQETRK